MAEYIDREAAQKQFDQELYMTESERAYTKSVIRKVPAAEVALVVRGRWERDGIMSGEYVCSVCGGSSWYYDTDGRIAKSKYCPNCGAKMDGGADDG